MATVNRNEVVVSTSLSSMPSLLLLIIRTKSSFPTPWVSYVDKMKMVEGTPVHQTAEENHFKGNGDNWKQHGQTRPVVLLVPSNLGNDIR